ncbi:histone-fold-containing protein [Tricladium varicosporioides]|nr:histone-fold-containing protein [Hymenoscyphus varicosporioides]
MPPKKVDPNKPAADAAGAADLGGVNIEDHNLPKSIVTRLAKGVLPPNTQIQGNAMLAMTKSATVFINYLTTHAAAHAQAANRKMMNPNDVFAALDELEFPDWKERLEPELAKYNEIQAEKKLKASNRKAEGKAGAEDDDHETDEGEGESQLERDGQPAAKKARIEPGSSSNAGGAPEKPKTDDQAEGEEDGEEENEDDENEEEEEEERGQEDDQLEDAEHREAEDEALDNGEDSD